jgi:hypothetical protein
MKFSLKKRETPDTGKVTKLATEKKPAPAKKLGFSLKKTGKKDVVKSQQSQQSVFESEKDGNDTATKDVTITSIADIATTVDDSANIKKRRIIVPDAGTADTSIIRRFFARQTEPVNEDSSDDTSVAETDVNTIFPAAVAAACAPIPDAETYRGVPAGTNLMILGMTTATTTTTTAREQHMSNRDSPSAKYQRRCDLLRLVTCDLTWAPSYRGLLRWNTFPIREHTLPSFFSDWFALHQTEQ